MKVIEKMWFTNNQGCIGIITCEEDVTGDRKAYIGIGCGKDEGEDTEGILAWGNKFSLDTAQIMVSLLTIKGGDKDGLPGYVEKANRGNGLPDN